MDKLLPPLRIPINMSWAIGAYTAAVNIGSQQVRANLVLDTGSATLAVRRSVAHPGTDASLKPTALAQAIRYGAGGWVGCVVNTRLSIGQPPHQVSLPSAPIALIEEEPTQNFYHADGVWGLAYRTLNDAYNLRDFLIRHHQASPVTYPWSLSDLVEECSDSSASSIIKRRSNRAPKLRLSPTLPLWPRPVAWQTNLLSIPAARFITVMSLMKR